MKSTTRCLYSLIVATALLVAGCVHISSRPTVTGSGVLAEQEFDVGSFDSLSIESLFNVVVHDGDEPQLVIRADENLFDYIIAEQKDNTVYLSMISGYRYRNTDVTVEVTAPDLQKIDIRGGVVAQFDAVSTEKLDVKIGGAAKITGELDVQQLTIDVSGASKITLGALGDRVADSVTVKASGATSADISALPAKEVSVSASGAGKFYVQASESLDVKLSGACALTYTGDPEVTKRLAGAVLLRHKDE